MLVCHMKQICLFYFDRMQRKVLHQFVMMAKRQMPSRIGGHTDAEDRAAQEGSTILSSWCLFLIMNWVVPEKIHTPPMDGILEILAGGGVNDSGNPGGTGGWTWKSLLLGSFWPIVHAIRMFSSMSLQHSQTLKIVEIFCSHISHIP